MVSELPPPPPPPPAPEIKGIGDVKEGGHIVSEGEGVLGQLGNLEDKSLIPGKVIEASKALAAPVVSEQEFIAEDGGDKVRSSSIENALVNELLSVGVSKVDLSELGNTWEGEKISSVVSVAATRQFDNKGNFVDSSVLMNVQSDLAEVPRGLVVVGQKEKQMGLRREVLMGLLVLTRMLRMVRAR
ncbi:hypothetical protein U1Q18_001733 [Sarracenia purpurea var. burkii]